MTTTTTRPVRSGWPVLLLAIPGSLVTMLVAFGVYTAFGLCMEAGAELCPDDPMPSWWHLTLIYLAALVLVVGPALLAFRRGLGARPSGRGVTPLLVVSGALVLLGAIGAALMIF